MIDNDKPVSDAIAKIAAIERRVLASTVTDDKPASAMHNKYKQTSVPVTALQTLLDAARARVSYGHNDTCSMQLHSWGMDAECTCGHEELEFAVTRFPKRLASP